MFSLSSWTLGDDASVRDKVGRTLKLQGLIQLVLGLAMAICSFAAVDIDRSNMDNLKSLNRTAASYAVIGLDSGAALSSIWVIATGVLPALLESKADYNMLRLKVLFMVFSCMAASFFAPVITAAAVTGYIVRKSHVQLAVAMGVLSGIEFVVSFAASVYCCYSPWVWMPCKEEKKRKEKLKEVYIENAKKELAANPPEYQP